MHVRQQHVRIASKISVMRNLHKIHKDSFLGRPYLMFIFNVNDGGLIMFVFVSYLLYSSFQLFFKINYCRQLLVMLQEIEIQANNTLLFVL